MMSFEEFEQCVRSLLQQDEKWLHILPSIEPAHRNRLIKVLEAGVAMPLAFDLVLISKEESDEEFNVRWRSLTSGG